MTEQSAFSPDELDQIVRAPRKIARATALVDDQGLIGVFQELTAVAKVFIDGAQHGHEFVRMVSNTADSEGGGDETDDSAAQEVADALALTRAAMAIVRAKATEDEAHAYGAWLVDIATRVSEAAKNSDGERVGHAERHFIEQVTEATRA